MTTSPYTDQEWSEWSDELALLIPEDHDSRFSNPEGAQEGIVLDCLGAYLRQRAAVLALCDQWDKLSKGATGTTVSIREALEEPEPGE